MIFKETTFFTKRLLSLMTDEQYREIQEFLINDPASGKIIKGSGGIRKLRWSLGSHGKSGGVRIIYYWYTAEENIFMLLLYRKNEADDLTDEQLKQLKKIVENELSSN